ncbi:hypothetical protein GUITHDRAFT_151046 [Guillardia theta CCMP2712]|uniref:PSI domain-containing protein n=2 Tax=Guillardia theta TaxID=55529 RepID=L1JS21_GUITC|nr:hypothetical protein GUITHDRAFT_151046 [Guillardia theta CCMP2712]EKX51346.1 hypothetical protein GUITHDRAFT_151046 [Guillardia theta CCMP2712]|eukprot:XP_005838326.1 hypothetical protein GUITHDRAFT_151046 [Guillardia theta CCMP2712]
MRPLPLNRMSLLALALVLFQGAHGKENSVPVQKGPNGKPLPSCSEATNCFDCFVQQECYPNPLGGDPICSPCGWCSHNHSASWTADVKGTCVIAPVGMFDFCQLVDPGADRYCPESVCKVGDFGCACKDNVCPAIEKLIGLFTLEGIWLILLTTLAIGVCVTTLCIWSICCSRQRRVIIVNYYDPENGRAALHDVVNGPAQGGLQVNGATTAYTRFQ